MSSLIDTLTSLTEEDVRHFLDRYRSLGPLPGIALTFMKSFVPPLPTLIIVGVNAAVYGLWLGFLYSWLGMIAGCMTTFLIFRRLGEHRYALKWAAKPRVQRSVVWIRRNSFGYVFLLSLFPVGPFVVINIAAALARMPLRSFLIAIVFGKAVMVMSVSMIGHDVESFMREPARLLYVGLFVLISFIVSKRIEAWFTRASAASGT
ncbi:TVP38/TMEM64 family protein [Paenibacillus methanolicus]|uniref:TVP38/TMEM64 family membrane protein n=1 Tax=Paenibacillus methanolicus TaxID=582686 RepID=A0A5S5BRK3_9BACL|nr:TVP38/TMEM64 family protein [Paenibacillus methanolicus]TYP69554.1 putative membrane protein YdjX (TVP38/TMEM64 family) [Paenibacillus methanolicus]